MSGFFDGPDAFRFGRATGVYPRIAVIASGPSLAGFDFGPLARSGLAVIAVNETAAKIGWATHAFTLDSALLRTRLAFYYGAHYAAVPDDYLDPGQRKKGWREKPVGGFGHIKFLRRVEADRLSDDRGTINHCHNSGSGGLNLAWHFDPKKILLLGFDHRDTDRYWYGPGRLDDAARPWTREFAFYANAALQAEARGVEIVNGSPDSAIPSFKKLSPREGVEWLL